VRCQHLCTRSLMHCMVVEHRRMWKDGFLLMSQLCRTSLFDLVDKGSHWQEIVYYLLAGSFATRCQKGWKIWFIKLWGASSLFHWHCSWCKNVVLHSLNVTRIIKVDDILLFILLSIDINLHEDIVVILNGSKQAIFYLTFWPGHISICVINIPK